MQVCHLKNPNLVLKIEWVWLFACSIDLLAHSVFLARALSVETTMLPACPLRYLKENPPFLIIRSLWKMEEKRHCIIKSATIQNKHFKISYFVLWCEKSVEPSELAKLKDLEPISIRILFSWLLMLTRSIFCCLATKLMFFRDLYMVSVDGIWSCLGWGWNKKTSEVHLTIKSSFNICNPCCMVGLIDRSVASRAMPSREQFV